MNPLKKSLIALIVMTAPVVASACGNDYNSTGMYLPLNKGQVTLHAMLHNHGKSLMPYWSHGFGKNIVYRLKHLSTQVDAKAAARSKGASLSWADLERALKNNVDYKVLSDYAWAELRVGVKANAVKLLERLYEEYPEEYNIVANLGTAYEVTGKNEKALELLKKAVAINADSHHNSEWIHIKILEQKINKQPSHASIVDLKAGNDYAEWLATAKTNTDIQPDSLLNQLAFQLHERISFIKAPDKIVGQLVLDFADLVAVVHSREKAKEFYTFALKYDPLLKKGIDVRLKTTLPVDKPAAKEPQ